MLPAGLSITRTGVPVDELKSAPGSARVYAGAEVGTLDRLATEACGLPGIVLMRRAGGAAFAALRRAWPQAARLTVVCGKGNNAGDGYVIAGLAISRGFAVQLLQVGQAEALSGDAARARDWAVSEGVSIHAFTRETSLEGDVVVDALLGTGLKGELRSAYAEAVERINSAGLPVLAVDIPTGLSADTGAVLGAAVCADVTPTFIGLKRGLFTAVGPDHTGAVVFDDLGVPDDLYADPAAPHGVELMRLGRAGLALPARARTAHKGAFGHVLIIGGDLGTGGAVAMAAEAALRTGAGLVSAATRGEHVAPLLARTPEVMVRSVAARGDLDALVERASVLVVGPGLGTAPWGEQLLDRALEAACPMVLDADALNLLAARGLDAVPAQCVLTPHPGEAARLLDTDAQRVQADRFGALAALRARTSATVVLKGAGTLVGTSTADGEQCALGAYGNPGMAAGGMGDVLSGTIGALLGAGLAAADAARLGVCLHAGAADRAAVAGERGLRPTDLMASLHHLVNAVDHA